MAIRSPGYPFINLEEAIEKASMLYQHDKRSATSTEVLAAHWNYSPTSSGSKLALAALKKFGLLDSVGSKKSGQVKLSDLALRILLDQREDSPERANALKRAALSPDLHRELWRKWGAEIPSDATVKTYLIMERGFNDSSVGGFLREYKETISFAKLEAGDKIPEDDSPTNEGQSADMNVAPLPTPNRENEQWRFAVPAMGPALGTAAKGSMLPLPFPLIGGGMAILHVPIPLSQKNFAYLKQMITVTLDGMKEAIVREEGLMRLPRNDDEGD